MAGHDRSAELDERAATSGRLAAMGLRAQPPGWVPAPLATVEPAPGPPAATEAGGSPIAAAGPPPAAMAPPTVGGLARAWLEDRLPPWAPGLLGHVRLGSVVAGLMALTAVVLAGVMLLHHHAGGSYSASYDASVTGPSYSTDPASSAAPTTPPDATSIVVDVGGRVRKPGLVTLPAGARVADAIAAAGGPLRHKEVATLDLAARVSDGQLLLIGVKTAPAVGGSATDPGDGTSSDGSSAPVSLSTATIDELETLPGVGPVTAQKIIDWRTAHNGFATVAALQDVPGIGPAKFAELSPLVTP